MTTPAPVRWWCAARRRRGAPAPGGARRSGAAADRAAWRGAIRARGLFQDAARATPSASPRPAGTGYRRRSNRRGGANPHALAGSARWRSLDAAGGPPRAAHRPARPRPRRFPRAGPGERERCRRVEGRGAVARCNRTGQGRDRAASPPRASVGAGSVGAGTGPCYRARTNPSEPPTRARGHMP